MSPTISVTRPSTNGFVATTAVSSSASLISRIRQCGKGWILAMEPADPSEIDKLLTAGAYAEVVEEVEE